MGDDGRIYGQPSWTFDGLGVTEVDAEEPCIRTRKRGYNETDRVNCGNGGPRIAARSSVGLFGVFDL